MPTDFVELPFRQAIAYLLSLRPTPADVLEEYELAARSQAFFASRVYKLEVLQGMLEQLTETVATGGTLEDFVERFSGEGLADFHLETIFRTNLQNAYGAGAWDQAHDPDVAGEIWGWRYHTVGDDQVREEHQELDDLIFEMDGSGDAVWPPWDFNCRCSSELITNLEAEEEGLKQDAFPESVSTALGESDFASPALGAEYRPDLTDFDPRLIAEYTNDQQGAQ